MALPFVILMTGRTGSSHLVSCLDSHPRVVADGERLVGIPDADRQLEWIDHFYRRRRFRTKAVGFKTKLKDVHDLDAFKDRLRRHRVHVIHMMREDTLRQAISVLRARELKAKHGVWNRGMDTPRLGPSHIDTEELSLILDEVVRNNEELARFVSDLGLPTHAVRYEDLLRDPDTVIGSVQDGLGLRRAPLVGSTRKTTDDRLERIISNYDEVRVHLRGTEAERFLTDDT